MKFPVWAPQTLVDLFEKFQIEKNEFEASSHDIEELNAHAWAKGYLNWDSCEKVLNLKMEVVCRLVTRPEMESVWKWVDKQNFHFTLLANGGLVGNLLRMIDRWHVSALVPQAERDEDFQEIRNHANALVLKLQKYRGENQPFNSYISLLPTRFKEEYQRKFEEGNQGKQNISLMPLNLFAGLIPPLHQILEKLITLVKENKNDLPSYFPKKITAENAFRTFLINNTIQKLDALGSVPPPTIVSKFIGVALDDYSVTPDIVRKSLAMKRTRSNRQ